MALDGLKKKFENLRGLINNHRGYLKQDETRTRQVLIDPLLKELGWDVGDPSVVELERRIVKGQAGGVLKKADYVLSHERSEVAVVEAKRLGYQLDDEVTTQASTYANINNIPWVVVTDGDQWRMHKVFQAGSIEDRTVMQFQVTEDDASKCALRSLALWRPNICNEDGPVEAVEPVVKPVTPPPPPNGGNDIKRDWHSFTEVKPADGDGDKKPTWIKFEGDDERSVSSWGAVYRRTAEDVVDNRSVEYPVILAEKGAIRRCAINARPVHPNGRSFNSKIKVREGVWLENGVGLNSTRWDYSMRLLRRFGIEPSTVKVAFD